VCLGALQVFAVLLAIRAGIQSYQLTSQAAWTCDVLVPLLQTRLLQTRLVSLTHTRCKGRNREQATQPLKLTWTVLSAAAVLASSIWSLCSVLIWGMGWGSKGGSFEPHVVHRCQQMD